MQFERKLGVVAKVCLTPGKADAYIRIGDDLVHVTMASRGVLNPDKSIRLCINGERYKPLVTGQDVAVDFNLHPRRDPVPVFWAPTRPIEEKEAKP